MSHLVKPLLTACFTLAACSVLFTSQKQKS
jgi:hypothetical protein